MLHASLFLLLQACHFLRGSAQAANSLAKLPLLFKWREIQLSNHIIWVC